MYLLSSVPHHINPCPIRIIRPDRRRSIIEALEQVLFGVAYQGGALVLALQNILHHLGVYLPQPVLHGTRPDPVAGDPVCALAGDLHFCERIDDLINPILIPRSAQNQRVVLDPVTHVGLRLLQRIVRGRSGNRILIRWIRLMRCYRFAASLYINLILSITILSITILSIISVQILDFLMSRI